MKKLEDYKLADYSGKILIQYLRRKDRSIRGVVLSTGKNVLGWSLCDPYDTFKKEKGLAIALARAEKAAALGTSEDQVEYYANMPHSLFDIAEAILDRSKVYFKQPE